MRNRLASSNPLPNFFQRFFLNEKLNNWVGVLIVTFIAVGFAFLLASNLIIGLSVFAAIIGIFVLFMCILNPELGLYFNMLYLFLAPSISRFFNDQVPVGVVTDVLVFTTFLGLFFSNRNLKRNTNLFFKITPAIYYTIILVYLTLELANPLAHSFEGWVQVMRKVFESFLIVFIAYNVLDSMPKIRRFLQVLFYFSLIIALYGCFQQWHGLLPMELSWVHADPLRYGLIYVFGEYRKFSILGGPTDFGIIMASCSSLFIVLSINEKKWATKIVYGIGSIFMLLGMSFSGTRTANAMVIGGIGIYLLLTIDRWSTKIFAFFVLLLFLFIMYVPIYSSITLIRFRSTFSAQKDASYNVREINRKRVQPFILSHPFGGGLSTTGENGKKYNPGNPNAGFPTDSSYLNKALESGWVGLILTLLLYYSILHYVTRSYFLAKNNELKKLFAASLAFFFCYFLGEIAQEAVGEYTNMVVFFPVLAIVFRLRLIAEESLPQDVNIQSTK